MAARWGCAALLLAAAVSGTVHASGREKRQAGGSCTTSDNRPGTCVSIRSCPALNQLLRQAKRGGSGTRDALNKLRRETFRCPFSHDNPLVCCESGSGTSPPLPQQNRQEFFSNQQTTRRPFVRSTQRPSSGAVVFVDRTQQTTRRPQVFNSPHRKTRRPQVFVNPPQRTTRRPQFVNPTRRTTRRPQQTFGSNNQQTFGSSNQQTFGSSNQQAFGSNNQQTFGSNNQQTFGSNNQQPAFGSNNRQAFGSNNQQSFGSGGQRLPGKGECGRRVFSTRVFGGRDAQIGSWPWAASIGYRRGGSSDMTWNCGATLITTQYLVTAAHCVSELVLRATGHRPTVVRLGELDFNREPDCLADDPSFCADPHQDVPIASVTAHHGYRGRSNNVHADDIALVRMSRSVRVTEYVRPICLPVDLSDLKDGSDSSRGQRVYAAGWGRSGKADSVDGFTPILQEVELSVVSGSECERTYRRGGLQSLGRRLCATGAERGADTCGGDSGGPLMMPDQFGSRWYLTGVTSFGSSNCGSQEGVYTRVHDYIGWIRNNIR